MYLNWKKTNFIPVNCLKIKVAQTGKKKNSETETESAIAKNKFKLPLINNKLPPLFLIKK